MNCLFRKEINTLITMDIGKMNWNGMRVSSTIQNLPITSVKTKTGFISYVYNRLILVHEQFWLI